MARSIAVDGAGNAIVTGTFQGTASFGGSALTSEGATEVFVAKYGAAGTHVWSMRLGGWNDDGGMGVATDASGHVGVTGYFAYNFIHYPGPDLVATGGPPMFVVTLDP